MLSLSNGDVEEEMSQIPGEDQSPDRVEVLDELSQLAPGDELPLTPNTTKTPTTSPKDQLALLGPPTRKDNPKRARMEEPAPKAKQTATQWLAALEKNALIASEIGSLLGRSSVNIQAQEGRITTPFICPVPKIGGIIHTWEKALDPKNTNVLKFHVFRPFWSTLLPALIVQHYAKFSQNVISELQSVSLIRWEFKLIRRSFVLEIPKGEICFFEYKAQHEVLLSDSWLTALLYPVKTYIHVEKMQSVVCVRQKSMTLEINRTAFQTRDDSPLLNEVRRLQERIYNLCYSYAKTKLLAREKQRDYYAEHLKGLQSNLTEILEIDSKQHYQYPRHWYFRNLQLRESNEQKNGNWSGTKQQTTQSPDTTGKPIYLVY